jgi:hypothetical protein
MTLICVVKKKSTNKTGFGSKVDAVLRSSQKERRHCKGKLFTEEPFFAALAEGVIVVSG